MDDHGEPASAFDPTRPNVARVYDYLLGGKDNYAADRALGDQIIATLPTVQTGVQAQRELLSRVVRYLVHEAGIRQLIDIGSGLPTADNVHEIAHRYDTGTRVVYVDNDPIVLAHARALLAHETTTIAVDGNLCEPTTILENSEVRAHLDWDEPIGLLLCGILHYVLDDEHPGKVIRTLSAGLPHGSYVFIHHLLDAGDPEGAELQASMAKGLGRVQFRTMDQIRTFFGGLEFVEPGLVHVPDWRPNISTPRTRDVPVLRLACAGVARKP
ncbi:MAG TPA: SAM-dependent methyltransferase [Streptosporangiaceae bacterium]|nr:SAM-dependent methyltransferase [Streptosporangiaceae bacterium]